MTHDELAQFAAVKLDIGLILYPSWKGGVKYGYMRDECLVPFDLSSPDLMIKGMGVCPHRVAIKTSPEANERYVSIVPLEGRFAMKWYDKVEEIPVKFWEAWAEAEGGQGR